MLIAPRPDGSFDLRISAVERQFLVGVCGQLRALLLQGDDDPSLRRLFPTAYPDDEEREAFYRQMVRDELRDKHLAALETIERTASSTTLSIDELTQWMTAVNALRLVLGTRLDVTEDDEPFDVDEDDPDFAARLAYDLLSQVLGLIVRALSGG